MQITCPQCGFERNVPADKIPADAMVAKCPKCGCRFPIKGQNQTNKPTNNSDQPEEDIRVIASNAYEAEAKRFENEQKAAAFKEQLNAAKAQNPWQIAPEPYGWPTAFYQTVLGVMLKPAAFFLTLRRSTPIGKAFAFFVIISIFQTLVERLWGKVIYSFLSDAARDDEALQQLLKLLNPDTSIFVLISLRSFALIVQLFVFALLMFLAYRIVAREKTSFSLVFQIVAYSSAPWVLCIIPAAGSVTGTIWGIACLALGCQTAMRLTWPQTLIGFLPLIAIFIPLLPQMLSIFAS